MRISNLSVWGVLLLVACSDEGAGMPQALPGGPLSMPSLPTTTTGVAPGTGGAVAPNIMPPLNPGLSPRSPEPNASSPGSPSLSGKGGGPAPIQGGTLLITRDSRAVVSDPDRDRVVIVDLEGQQVLANLSLKPGDEPGRAAEDDAGQVHVVLRHAGEIATIALADNRLLRRTGVCSMPEGIVFEPSSHRVHVACADGQLVSVAVADGEIARKLHVDSDLRDVLLVKGKLLVTRFKAAEVLELDGEGAVVSRRKPTTMKSPFVSPSNGVFSQDVKTFEPAVAWRTVVAPDGRLAMVHQRGQVEAIDLHQGAAGSGATGEPIGGRAGGGGGFSGELAGAFAPPIMGVPGPFPGATGSAYGGAFGCDGIMQAGVTYMDGQGVVEGPLVPKMVLPVDAAISPDGRSLAIATPGSYAPRTGGDAFGALIMPMGLTPRSENATSSAASPAPAGDVAIAAPPAVLGEPIGPGVCLLPGRDAPGQTLVPGEVVALAYDAKGRLVLQTREPNTLRVLQANEGSCQGCENYTAEIDLGGVPRRDIGHDLFHLNAGAGLACASCHPGGADDGRTWTFTGIGPRRTQLFNMGVRDTAPLHWDGEFSNMNELLLDVFVKRMGGNALGLEEAEGLQDYVETLRPGTPMRAANDEAAMRGKTLFESKGVGCTECHSGAKLTNNKTVDVGTGGMFQVPSLIGVAYHQPYMHTGCAQTLRDRFSTDCGGDKHGKTSGLSDAQIGDLVAYLESL